MRAEVIDSANQQESEIWAMKTIFPVLLTILVLIIAGTIFIYSGTYNVAASEEHTSVGRWILNTVQTRSIKNHAHREVDLNLSPSPDKAYRSFTSMCVMCHGSLTQKRWAPAQNMTPMPPSLHEAAEEWTAGEMAWIIEHGIKMTGMPAFGPSHSRQDIERLAAFVNSLPEYTVTEFELLSKPGTSTPDTDNGAENHGHDSHTH
jgi:cytochrome c553